MARGALQCPQCSSLNFKRINDYQVKCKKCGCVFQSYDHAGFVKNVVQDAAFISIDEKFSMIRGLIAGKQFEDALARLHELENERGGMDEFQFLKAKAISQNFTIVEDSQIKSLLDSAESMANRNGNEDLQEEIVEARQRLARAETARPVRDNLRIAEEQLNDAQTKEREVRSSIESLQKEYAKIEQEISILQIQSRKKTRGIILNRCLRLFPFIIGIIFIIIAALACLRTSPEASNIFRQKAPEVYSTVNDFILKHNNIPFIASNPISFGDVLENIPIMNTSSLSNKDDFVLLIISTILGIVFLKMSVKSKRIRNKIASLKKEKTQVSSLKKELRELNQNVSEKRKELDARSKTRQEIDASVNKLQIQLNQLIGD